MIWLAIILAVQCLVIGLIAWCVMRKNASTVSDVLLAARSNAGEPINSAEVCQLLATAGKALSDHSTRLEGFERSLKRQSRSESQPDPTVIREEVGEIRDANHAVEDAVESTIENLIATCGQVLGEEEATLRSYQNKTRAFDRRLDDVDREALLAHLAGSLLEMVRELREENKMARNEVAAGHDKIIQLVTRASSAEQIARLDALTQLPNRRAFDEALSECYTLLHESGQTCSLILLDIDHFKLVNDQYGHATGDAVLSLLSRILRESAKTSDHLCRLGGEEFAVLLPRCEEKPARIAAERIRRKIEAAVLHHSGQQVSVTVSCGVAEAARGEPQSRVLERADIALYAAKSRGRNQTCTFLEIEEEQSALQPASA